jgi:hypothetical protein
VREKRMGDGGHGFAFGVSLHPSARPELLLISHSGEALTGKPLLGTPHGGRVRESTVGLTTSCPSLPEQIASQRAREVGLGKEDCSHLWCTARQIQVL